jgi:hypothetical protein
MKERKMQNKTIDYKDVWSLLHEYIEAGKESDRRLKEQIQETDRQLKDQIKETDRQLKDQIKETNRHIKETDRQLKETDRQLKETDRQLKETDKLLKKTIKGIESLNTNVGGIGNSNGFYAEDIFYYSLAKTKTIGNMTFDSIYRNLGSSNKVLEDEFDIVCLNSSVAVIIETKYNFHPNDVETVLKKVDNFRILNPQYKDYKIFGGIAGLTIRKETIKTAKTFGFFVLTQEGNDIKILNDQVKEIGNH